MKILVTGIGNTEEKLTLTRKFVAHKKAEYEELQRELEMQENGDKASDDR